MVNPAIIRAIRPSDPQFRRSVPQDPQHWNQWRREPEVSLVIYLSAYSKATLLSRQFVTRSGHFLYTIRCSVARILNLFYFRVDRNWMADNRVEVPDVMLFYKLTLKCLTETWQMPILEERLSRYYSSECFLILPAIQRMLKYTKKTLRISEDTVTLIFNVLVFQNSLISPQSFAVFWPSLLYASIERNSVQAQSNEMVAPWPVDRISVQINRNSVKWYNDGSVQCFVMTVIASYLWWRRRRSHSCLQQFSICPSQCPLQVYIRSIDVLNEVQGDSGGLVSR